MFKDFLLIEDLTGGINSKQRPSKILDNQLVSILGFDFSANSLKRAKGYTKLGNEIDSELTGKTLYKHEILTGTDILVKTIGGYVKFYDENSGNWLKITDDTFTENKKWSFESFNGYLYGNNEVDNWLFWNGSARSSLASDISIGATTIDLIPGEGGRMPSSGTILIGDDVIDYAGKSTDQLTGVTGVDSDHTAGETVILKADSSTYSSLEKVKEGKNNLAFHSNRLYYISALNPRKILHSKLADNVSPETDLINFTVSGSGSGDAGFGFAPDELVGLKEYTNGNNTSVLVAFCKNGKAYSFVVTDTTTTTTNVYVPIRTMNSYPISSDMISLDENDLAFVDQFGHARTMSYGDQNSPVNVATISQFIEPSLESTFWDNGCMWYHNRRLWLGGSTSEDGTNDIYYYHDGNYNAWGSYGHWDAVDFEEYNAEMYCLSSISGNVFKLHDGYSVYLDDEEENNEGNYYSEAVTKEYNLGKPHTYKESLKIRMDGLITSQANPYLDIFLDGVLFGSWLIDGDNEKILGSVPNVAVGTIVFGQGVFGGSLPNGNVRKEFYAELAFPTLQNFLKIQLRLRLDGKNIDFEMTNLSIWAKECGKELWKKERIIIKS